MASLNVLGFPPEPPKSSSWFSGSLIWLTISSLTKWLSGTKRIKNADAPSGGSAKEPLRWFFSPLRDNFCLQWVQRNNRLLALRTLPWALAWRCLKCNKGRHVAADGPDLLAASVQLSRCILWTFQCQDACSHGRCFRDHSSRTSALNKVSERTIQITSSRSTPTVPQRRRLCCSSVALVQARVWCFF